MMHSQRSHATVCGNERWSVSIADLLALIPFIQQTPQHPNTLYTASGHIGYSTGEYRSATHLLPGAHAIESADAVRTRLHSLAGKIRRTARELRRPQGGVTLVGGATLPALPGSTDLPAAAQDVVHVEGEAQDESLSDAHLHVWLFQAQTEPHEVSLDLLPELVADEDNFVWVDLSSYTERDLLEVGKMLRIHHNAIHAALSPWHRPWLAIYPDHYFVSATVANLEANAYRIHASELDMIVGSNFLVSAHKRQLPFIERVKARARQSPELVSLDAAFMLYVMLDELLAYYEELNRHVQGEIERIEERALRDTSDAFLEDLLHFKRYAFSLSQLADQHREVFTAFFRPDFPWVAGEDVEAYFRDLESRLARLLATLNMAKDAVNGAFDIYVSQMSHRTNQVIKVLTMVSTLLLPATLLIALFGATIQSILPSYGSLWFGVMLLSILFLCGGILTIFRRQHWL